MKKERCSNCKSVIRLGPTVKDINGKPFTHKHCKCTDELNRVWGMKERINQMTDPKTLRSPMDNCTVILKYIGKQCFPKQEPLRLWNVMNGRYLGATRSIQGLKEWGLI